MKFKLLERRAKARQTLGKLEEGVADVDDAVAALEKANLAQEKRDGKKAELQRFGVESTSREMMLELFVVVVLCFCVFFYVFLCCFFFVLLLVVSLTPLRLRKELSTALAGGGSSRGSSPKPLEPLLPGENPKFPTFSDAVRIRSARFDKVVWIKQDKACKSQI